MMAGILLILIFISLSTLHWYWVAGGTKGLDVAIPTGGDHRKVFQPGRTATIMVALGLIVLAAMVGYCFTDFSFPGWLDRGHRVGLYAVTVVFLLRAIGDFRYVGFFKRYRDSRFARYDTRFYSPLCLVIAGLLVLLIGGR
jgi:hypothetical protein